MSTSNLTAWLPELIYDAGDFQTGVALVSDEAGTVSQIGEADQVADPVPLKDRALLPGLINAHSHAFQRVIRGRTEYRTANKSDSFWTWRELMYRAAAHLTPEDVYDASRMAFLEMALSGTTAVGEFHYLHHAPDGSSYDDPNLLAKEVVRAANDVGLRIALLRVAYARSGNDRDVNPQQLRFVETDPETYLKNAVQLATDLGRGNQMVWTGIAPHSVRAVPIDYMKEIVRFANERTLPVHMHVAEQPAEVSACIEEYGRSPVALLATEGLLSERFTAVHAIHVTPKAVRRIADANAMVCACPTTERNLGDGVIPVDSFFVQGVRVALGTDSHIQIDLLEDARELEYHLRLQTMERAVLDPGRTLTSGGTARRGLTPSDSDVAVAPHESDPSALAARLFNCATVSGAESLQAPGGFLEQGRAADFFTVDLNDPSIAGASKHDLLASIVFSLSRVAVRDVVVGGKLIVKDGRHPQQEEIVQRFKALQKRLWNVD